MRSFNRLPQTRGANCTLKKQTVSTRGLRVPRLRVPAFGTISAALSLVVFTGLALSLGRPRFRSLHVGMMAEAASLPQPMPSPQRYQPKFRDLVGSNGGLFNADVMNTMKIGAVRAPFYWHEIEPQRGQWNWTAHDNLVMAGNNHNIMILPMLGYMVPWAAAGPGGGARPKNPADWVDFVTAVVSRYSA